MAQKVQAATEMGRIREAVQFLCYSLLTDPEYPVRDADVTSLGNLGGAEAKTCLVKVKNEPPPDAKTNLTAQDVKEMTQAADLHRHVMAVLERLH
jgi:hypothetical protein